MTDSDISAAWLAEDLPPETSEVAMVWDDLAATPEWRRWLDDHIVPLTVFSMVTVDERDRTLMRVTGDDLSYFVPAAQVRAVAECGTLAELMQQIFIDVWRKRWERPGQVPLGVSNWMSSSDARQQGF